MTDRYYPIDEPLRCLLKVRAEHATDGSHHYVSLTAYFPDPDTATIPPMGRLPDSLS